MKLLGSRREYSLSFSKAMFICVAFIVLAAVGCSSSNNTNTSSDTIALSASTYAVAEDGNWVEITVTRTGTGSGAVNVNYATSDGSTATATPGADYIAINGNLNWADGDTANKTITVSITDDNQYEGDETLAVTLSSVSGGILGTTSAILTITEEDTPGTLAIASASLAVGVTETDASGVQAIITVSRATGSDGDISISYATVTGTADSGDYTAVSSGTLQWAHADSADKTITIEISGDSDSESSEAFTVVLSSPQASFLDSSNTTSTITITDDDWVTVAGTVSAPSGAIAFNGPSFLQRMFNKILGSANAALSDLVSPVANSTVEVFQVDASGAVVGSAMTTSTTDGSGDFSVAAPEVVSTGSAAQFIVRASGSSGNLDSRISSTSGLAVDPSTDATSDLIAATNSDLSAISAAEISNITEVVANLIDNVTTSGVSATVLSTNLQTEITNNEAANNEITSKSATGLMCGTVTDSAGAGIASVRIVARDYGNWVTRARTKTDSNGDYCLNVPKTGDTDPFTGNTLAGEYIVGAINRTGQTNNPLKSASEWYTASGGADTQFGGDKVTVANTIQVTIDFMLADGARISGTVSTYDGNSAEGIRVQVRKYNTFTPLASARVKADGTFRVSVPAGDYLIMAVNKTLSRAYASIVYTTDSAATAYNHSRHAGERVTVATGNTRIADFTLQLGYQLSGEVFDAPSAPSTAVQGVRVRVDLVGDSNFGGSAARLRTRKNGSYRIWLKPGSYSVRSIGQGPTTVDMSLGNVANTNFNAQTTTITGILNDGAGKPVSQAKLFLYSVDTTNATSYVYTMVNQELSNSDGSFILYVTSGVTAKLLIRFDEATVYSSMVYLGANGTTTINGGDNVSGGTTLGTIVLPTQGVTGGSGALANGAGILTGTIASNLTTSIAGGQKIEVRATATNNTARFVTARTLGDGTYTIPLPVGSTYRVRILGTNTNNVTIIDGATTTVNQ